MRLQPSVMSVGLGAGIMYLLDPEHGVRRRAQLQQRAAGLRSTAGEAAHGVRERSRQLGKLATRLRPPMAAEAGVDHLADDLPGDGAVLGESFVTPPRAGAPAHSARAIAGVVGGSLLLVGAGLLLRTLRHRAVSQGSARTLGRLPRLPRPASARPGAADDEPEATGVLDDELELLAPGAHGAGHAHDGALGRL